MQTAQDFFNLPATRIPNVATTSAPSKNAMDIIATRATGKRPFTKAFWIEKYRMTPVQPMSAYVLSCMVGFIPIDSTMSANTTAVAPSGRAYDSTCRDLPSSSEKYSVKLSI